MTEGAIVKGFPLFAFGLGSRFDAKRTIADYCLRILLCIAVKIRSLPVSAIRHEGLRDQQCIKGREGG